MIYGPDTKEVFIKHFTRFVCCIIVIALLTALWATSAFAYKENEILHIANCKNWVSLREKPTPSVRCLKQIPLGALAFYDGKSGDFIRVCYGGTVGYVGKQYVRSRDKSDRVPMYVANLQGLDLAAQIGIDLLGAHCQDPARGESDVAESKKFQERHEQSHLQGQDRLHGFQISLPAAAQDQEERTMHVPRSSIRVDVQQGKDYTQKVTRKKRLEALLCAAVPSESGKCPYEAQFVIKLTNGNTLRLMYPVDFHTAFFTSDHSVYAIPESKSREIWKIFDKACDASRLGWE